jgi:hypothetical protein
LHFDNARPLWSDHEITANNITRLSHVAYSLDFAPTGIWLCGYLKEMLKGTSIETAEELQGKMTDILISTATQTFRAVFEEWKSQLL